MLLVDGLRVTIKGFIILRGVSLVVPTGELIALVGRNGAGKTTTLKSIMGLMPISGGTVQLDGTALTGVPGYRRAALGIGYMPEDRRLIGSLTAEDNIRMPAWASRLAHGEARLAYIYEKMPDGTFQLNGVEFLVPISAWKSTEPPRIMGQALIKADPIGFWFLHVWTWKPSTSGLFSPWNPDVKCLDTSSMGH